MTRPPGKETAVARRVEVQLIDDLDGGRADETVKFALDGIHYEIDLSKKNAAKLRELMGPYVENATKTGRTTGHTIRSRRGGSHAVRGTSARASREENQSVREWATSRGIHIAERGRIPAKIVEEFEKVQRGEPVDVRALQAAYPMPESAPVSEPVFQPPADDKKARAAAVAASRSGRKGAPVAVSQTGRGRRTSR